MYFQFRESHLTPEDPGSNPAISNFYTEHLITISCWKEAEIGPFKNVLSFWSGSLALHCSSVLGLFFFILVFQKLMGAIPANRWFPKHNIFNSFSGWQDSNPRPLAWEGTALPTVPQLLPNESFNMGLHIWIKWWCPFLKGIKSSKSMNFGKSIFLKVWETSKLTKKFILNQFNPF